MGGCPHSVADGSAAPWMMNRLGRWCVPNATTFDIDHRPDNPLGWRCCHRLSPKGRWSSRTGVMGDGPRTRCLSIRVTVAAGWFGSPLPISSRALGSRLLGFYPFSPCRVGDPGRWPSRCQATTAMIHCTVLPLGLCPLAPCRGARPDVRPQPRHPLVFRSKNSKRRLRA